VEKVGASERGGGPAAPQMPDRLLVEAAGVIVVGE